MRLDEDDCSLRLGFVVCSDSAAAIRLESDLILEFEKAHGEWPPFNRQSVLDLRSRIAERRGADQLSAAADERRMQ